MLGGMIGIGRLGADLVTAMVGRGCDVLAYDVAVAAFESVPASVARAGSIAEVAERRDVIGVVVRTDAQVQEVVDALVVSARAGTTVLLHSTVGIDTVRQAAAALGEIGVDVLDAPVCRFAGYESSTTALVGGDPAVVARATPLLEAMTDGVVHLGPLGTGMTAKAIRNATLYASYAAAADALTIALGAGIDGAALGEVLLRTGAASPSSEQYLGLRREWLDGGGVDVSLRAGYTDLAHKDIDIALAIAAAAGVDVPFTAAVRAAMAGAYLT